MKKEIVDKLIKVADNLDSLGYMREANIVDRVAKKIVLSANPEYISKVSLDEAARLKFTANYVDDILKYKKLSFLYFKLNSENKLKDMQLIGAYKKSLLDAVKNTQKFTPEQKIAFLAQAERIDEDYRRGFPDINEQMGDETTVSLNEYLVKYRIAYYEGGLYKDITDRATFNERWNQFLKDPVIMKQRKLFPQYLKIQLNSTYKILTAKLPYDSD